MIRNKKLIKSSTLEDAFTVYPWSNECWKHSDHDLGLSYAVEAYGEEFLNLDDSTLNDLRDTLITYFDDEAYVRDWNINYPDDQIEEFSDIMTEEDLSNEELARYFDYERYGRDIRLENNMIWDNKRECWFSGNDTDDYDIDDVTFLGSSRKSIKSALTQKQKNTVLDYIKENNFFPCNNGEYFYFIVPVDDEHIKMNPTFKKQLEDEGLYANSFIGGLTDNNNLPIDMKWLPIYGDSNRYVTKWFKNSYESCFSDDLKDRERKLARRLDIDSINTPQNVKSSRKPIKSALKPNTSIVYDVFGDKVLSANSDNSFFIDKSFSQDLINELEMRLNSENGCTNGFTVSLDESYPDKVELLIRADNGLEQLEKAYDNANYIVKRILEKKQNGDFKNAFDILGATNNALTSVTSSRKPIKSAVDGGWRVDSSDVPEALDLFVEYVGEETALEEIARAMGTDVLEENIEYVAQQWDIAEDIEDLDAWEAYEKAKEIMGASELFTNLTQAAGYDELAEDLAFIFRMYDFREWNKYDNDEE